MRGEGSGRGGSEFPESEVRSGNPLYKPFTKYVLPQRAGFLRHFGLKTRMVLKGIYNMRVYECIYHLNSKCVRKKEKYTNLKFVAVLIYV